MDEAPSEHEPVISFDPVPVPLLRGAPFPRPAPFRRTHLDDRAPSAYARGSWTFASIHFKSVRRTWSVVLLCAFIVAGFGGDALAEPHMTLGAAAGGGMLAGGLMGPTADDAHVANRATMGPRVAKSHDRATPANGAGNSRGAVVQDTGDVHLGGFVMNETFSVIGNDFYTAFYGAWSEPEGVSMYTVFVDEEPAPRFGARIRVKVDDTLLYQAFLRPNNGKIRRAARQAVRRAQLYLQKYHEPRTVY